MKKLAYAFGFLLCVTSLTVAQASMTPQSSGSRVFDVNVPVHTGWNLLAGIVPSSGGVISSNSQIQPDDISAVWYYSPLQKKYIQIHPRPDWNGINQDDATFVDTSGMWVYAEKDGLISYKTSAEYAPTKKLYTGYNFVTLTPDMIGRTVGGVLKNCTGARAYSYDSANNTWASGEENGVITDEQVGYAFVVRSPINCTVPAEVVKQQLAPPSLPGLPAKGSPKSSSDNQQSTTNLVDKKTSEVLIEGSIGSAGFKSSSAESSSCGLHEGMCDKFRALYGSADYAFEVGVVIKTATAEEFTRLAVARYGPLSGEELNGKNTQTNVLQQLDLAGKGVYTYIDKESLFMMWPSKEVIVYLGMEPFDGFETPRMHDVWEMVEEYMHKYPSLLPAI